MNKEKIVLFTNDPLKGQKGKLLRKGAPEAEHIKDKLEWIYCSNDVQRLC